MTVEEAVHLALQQFQNGELAQSAEICRAILQQVPQQTDTLQLYGLIHLQAGDAKAAAELIARAALLDAGRIDFHYNLGRAFNALGRRQDAATAFNRAASVPVDDAGVLLPIAKELSLMGEFRDALAVAARVAASRPNDPEVLAIYAQALTDMGQYAPALHAVRQAIALRPDEPGPHWNLAMLLLRQGEYAEGWREFEWRMNLPGFPGKRDFSQPRWDGSDAAGKTVLLSAEGGFGDTIHYIRYVPMVRLRVGRVITECRPELISLLERMPGIDGLVPCGQALPPFDFQIPLPSLPGALKTEVGTIPNSVPYLSVAPQRLAKWESRVPRDGVKNIGLVWRANTVSADDMRNMDLNDAAPLAALKGVRYFNLQVGEGSKQPQPAGLNLTDYTADLRDFADTAALVSQLDLVISIDTSVAHLAGALGKPVWMLLPFVPSYQWLLDRSDTPWYPTMRLFRQKQLNDWSAPLAEILRALSQQ